MHHTTPRDRFELLVTEPSETTASFAEEVESGLRARPKRLPCRFFYDASGSELFEQICALPEYYLTRAETSILEKRGGELAERIDAPATLIELGSGSATKTRLLIETFLSRQERLTFVPIDISRSMLEESADALLDDYPQLDIRAVAGEYERGLERLGPATEGARLILWLGSSVGNLSREDAAAFLDRVRRAMGPADRLLIGIDLRKDAARLERAYDDGRGVTARFNLNLLERINHELGGRFDLRAFRHRAVYRREEGRVEMHLESRVAQRVDIEKLDLAVDFEEGETIHTESSYKYSAEEIEQLASAAGLRILARWLDGQELFSLSLLGRT
jgi:L-histidine N-alpha-methyltransferase